MATYDIWKNHSRSTDRYLVHGTAVALERRAVLLLGPSGTGKSSMAIDLIAAGGTLVADDRVWLDNTDDGISLQCPSTIAGRIEARGIGQLNVPFQPTARLSFCVDMSNRGERRFPSQELRTILGHEVVVVPGSQQTALCASILILLRHGIGINETC